MIEKVSKGDIWWYDFGNINQKAGYNNHVQLKKRPVVVISNDTAGTMGGVCVVAPVTSRERTQCKRWQTWYYDDTIKKDQVILTEQMRCVNIHDLFDYKGRLTPDIITRCDMAIAIELDLNIAEAEKTKAEVFTSMRLACKEIMKDMLTSHNNQVNEIYNKINYLFENFLKLPFEGVSEKQNKLDERMTLLEEKFNAMIDSNNEVIKQIINVIKNSTSLGTTVVHQTIPSKPISTDIKPTVVKEEVEIVKKKIEETITPEDDTKKSSNMDFQPEPMHWDPKPTGTPIVPRKKRGRPSKAEIEARQKLEGTLSIHTQSVDETKPTNEENTQPKPTNEPKKNGRGGPRPRITKESALEFLNDYNTMSMEELCEKYDKTAKALSAKKWTTTKWLTDHNISYEVVDKRIAKQ